MLPIKHIKLFLFFLLIFIFIAISQNVAVSANSWLHTDGNKIKNSSGQEIYLHGVNVYACMQNTQEKFNTISDMGANVVRLALWKNSIEGNPSGPCVGKNGLEEIDNAVKYAKNSGLMVILDQHMWSSGVENAPLAFFTDASLQSSWKSMWRLLIERYKNEPTVIGIDLMNEPWAIQGKTDADRVRWENIAKDAVNELRPLNPNIIIFINGWGMATHPMWSDINFFSGKSNLALSDHVYGDRGSDFLENRYKQYLDNGIPLWLGEIGYRTNEENYMMTQINKFDQLGLHYTLFVVGVNSWNSPYDIVDINYNLNNIGQTYKDHLKSFNQATQLPEIFVGDANNDKKVNEIDYTIWSNYYDSSTFGADKGDFNLNGKVDGIDYVLWAKNYHE